MDAKEQIEQLKREIEDQKLNYRGMAADLDSCLDVLIRRINGEADLESAATWVRLNYPARAKDIKIGG